jgi:hypothetical protein
MRMPQWRVLLLALLLPACGYLAVALAQTVTTHTEIFDFKSGLRVNGAGLADGGGAITGFRLTPPATETIAAGAIITANACGGLKRVSAAGAVTTSTVDTFTAPALTNTGCQMTLVNVGANTITLDKNAKFLTLTAADLVLAANTSVVIVSDGTAWRQVTAILAGT